MSCVRRRTGALVAILFAMTGPLAAQSCDASTSCRLGVRATEATLVATMLAAGAGNPWVASPSTLGFRTITFPRLAVQLRTAYTPFEVPDRGTGLTDASAVSLSGGFSMALLDGFAPAATVGGTGSVDVFAHAGVVFLPGDVGFESTTPFSWSLGARIGIFRESFTLPGITASVGYRRASEVGFDRPAVLQRETAFSWPGASAWQFRAVVGKRVAGLGLSGGFGWDRSSAETTVTYRTSGANQTAIEDVAPDRQHAFLGLSWTTLILALNAEAGWQLGTDAATGLGDRDPAAPGRAFGTLAARVTF